MSIKGELTKQRVLKTARELFYLNGYNNTSMDDIVRASKVKKGNLYFHYQSKEVLGFAVIDSYRTDEMEEIDRIFNGAGSAMDRIYRLLDSSKRQLMKVGCRGGCPIGNFALEMSDIHPGFRRKVNQVFTAWADRLERLLREAKRAGEIPSSINTRAFSHFMVAIWEGGVMLVKTQKNPKVLRDCLSSLKGIIRASRK